jgi:hypothetical protein
MSEPNAPLEALRARACDRAAWPCASDLVFTYEAGAADPRDWEADLPEPALLPLARALFEKLASGRTLPELTTVTGHTYNWGRDVASVTPQGDGVLVAEYCRGTLEDRARHMYEAATFCVHHVVVRDELVVRFESGSSEQRRARPTVTLELASSGRAALDVAADAVLEVAAAHGFTFSHRVDAPKRAPRGHRRTEAVLAFERVLARRRVCTATRFAWILIDLFPAWFDFADDKFGVEGDADDQVTLVLRSPRFPGRRATIALSSSRVIECRASGELKDTGMMSMHYGPSDQQRKQARQTLCCALHWLFPGADVGELPAIAPGRVFTE